MLRGVQPRLKIQGLKVQVRLAEVWYAPGAILSLRPRRARLCADIADAEFELQGYFVNWWMMCIACIPIVLSHGGRPVEDYRAMP